VSSRTAEIGDEIPTRVLEEAAAWFASLANAAGDESERERWQAWCAAHPDHARAWQRVEEISGQFSPLARAGKSTRRALEAPQQRGRRNLVKVLGLAVLVGGSGMLAARAPWREWRHELALRSARYRTGPGEVTVLSLEDGGRAWLGSRSALDIAYEKNLRRLTLHQGDLLVETAPDSATPSRPFVVDTVHARLRALGTRFAIRTAAQDSRVDVFQGAVAITLDGAGAPVHTVRANEFAVFDRLALRASGAADPGREAWARGILLADGMRLDALAAELAGWHARPVTCAPDVAGLQVVGAFPLKDFDRILARLESSLPVRVEHDGAAVRLVAQPEPEMPSAAVTPPRRLE
jgi:transmembrane sensor